MSKHRVMTPPASIDAALWIATLPPEDAAYIQGADNDFRRDGWPQPQLKVLVRRALELAFALERQ
jgi:hypothetical protein